MKFWTNLVVVCAVLLLAACHKFKPEELHGKWESPNWAFEFKPDNSMKMRLGQVETSGTYRLSSMGNQIELINEEGKVIFPVTIDKLSGDTLQINKLELGTTNIYTLIRQK